MLCITAWQLGLRVRPHFQRVDATA
jgi:hypothetical protein